MTTYRVGNHQPQNVYRDDQYIGVMFTPEDAALVVEALSKGPAVAVEPRLAWTVEEAASMLRIGRTKAYALIAAGEIPSVMIGRHRRIRQSDLDAYMHALDGKP